MTLRRLRYAGLRLRCPLCGARLRSYAPFNGRPDAQCPRCGALERHRALWLLLTEHRPDLLAPGHVVLDIAPDASLERRLRAVDGLEYVSGDRDRDDVDVRLDLVALPFASGRFDVVLCSHVLEHVVDDAAAIGELRRVLRPGGTALVLVPLVPGVEKTVEDPAAVTPEQRLRTFGQPDHVRIYAERDVTGRLRAGGFEEVAVVTPLAPFDKIWVCSAAD